MDGASQFDEMLKPRDIAKCLKVLKGKGANQVCTGVAVPVILLFVGYLLLRLACGPRQILKVWFFESFFSSVLQCVILLCCNVGYAERGYDTQVDGRYVQN